MFFLFPQKKNFRNAEIKIFDNFLKIKITAFNYEIFFII